MYPEEQDSTINKIVNAESSFLAADFKGRAVERIHMWPETSGTVTPLFIAKKSLYFLPKFKWYESIRPLDRFDIFVVPEEMEAIMSAAPRPVPEKLQNKMQSQPKAIPSPSAEVLSTANSDEAAVESGLANDSQDSFAGNQSDAASDSEENEGGEPSVQNAEE